MKQTIVNVLVFRQQNTRCSYVNHLWFVRAVFEGVVQQ